MTLNPCEICQKLRPNLSSGMLSGREKSLISSREASNRNKSQNHRKYFLKNQQQRLRPIAFYSKTVNS